MQLPRTPHTTSPPRHPKFGDDSLPVAVGRELAVKVDQGDAMAVSSNNNLSLQAELVGFEVVMLCAPLGSMNGV